MTTTTKTTAKTTAKKTTAKTTAKTTTAKKTTAAPKLVGHPDTSLIAYILAETEKRIQARPSFYKTAADYHAGKGTVFPRAANDAARATFTREQADKAFEMFDKKILHPSHLVGQVCYDIYRMNKG
jgi:hypothetical protein